ncbi:MAG TPA: YdeI/OmpD-associated family protein [Verrucomicrobiae bacterium]|nr:YdeI/OmpD-associated family protein [Verrucomicrobiae bacterium]
MKLAKRQETRPTIRFRATLFRPKATGKIGSSALLTLPRNASAKLPSRGMTIVEGTINAIPFRAALEPDGKGSHQLRVNKAMHDAAGADAEDTLMVEITRVGEEPEVRVPVDLRQALAAAPPAQASWADITPLARRDWIFSISTAKQPETRRRRIEKACDMLASGKRRLCCFPGIKWLMKENAKSCGMWLPLPNSKNRPPPRSTSPE